MASHCQPSPPQETLQHQQVGLAQSPVGPLLLSPGSWHTQDFVCALQEWSPCFPLSCESPASKFHWTPKSGSLGSPSPFARSPGWEAWYKAQNLHKSGRTSLILLFSRLWITHPEGMGFDFIIFVPFLISLWLPLCLWTWSIFFFVGSSVFLSMIIQQLVNLGALAREDEHTSFHSALSYKFLKREQI